MTILVPGGAGYIGSQPGATARSKPVVRLSIPLVVGNTGDQACVAALIAEYSVDSIIHFAASIVVPDSVSDPLGYYRNNTVNSRALIETAVKAGVRALFSRPPRRSTATPHEIRSAKMIAPCRPRPTGPPN